MWNLPMRWLALAPLFLWACSRDSDGPPVVSSTFAEHATIDPQTLLLKIEQDASTFPALGSIVKQQGQELLRAYRLDCPEFPGLKKLVEAAGFDFSMLDIAPSYDVHDPLIQASLLAQNPVLSCRSAEDPNASLYYVDQAAGDGGPAERKYFISFNHVDAQNRHILHMIGCQELLTGMGFDLQQAKLLPDYLRGFFNLDDVYDINCVDGGECSEARPCADEIGEWSACSGFDDACDLSGVQTRQVVKRSCVDHRCGAAETLTETRPCGRDTEGVVCHGDSAGPWGACGGFSSACDTSGTQSRTVTVHRCHSGACTTDTRSEVRSCSRGTDGNTCGSDVLGTWGACGGFSETCDNSGTRSRTVTQFRCAAGSCGPVITTEAGSCTRNTDGTTCKPSSYGLWSACWGFSSTCDNTGSRGRSVTEYRCKSGSCAGSTATETASCTRNTNGKSCGDATYGSWSSCSYSSTCDESGAKKRSVTSPKCAQGQCKTSTGTESQTCSRDTDGRSCGTGKICKAGSCSGNTCVCPSGQRPCAPYPFCECTPVNMLCR